MRIPLTLIALWLPVSAQETMIREVFDPKTDTHVEVTALFSEPSGSGFLPVRVKVANNLKSDRSIQLRFTSSENYDRRLQCRSSFSITTPAGKTATRDLLVPLCPSQGAAYMNPNVTVELSGSLGTASNTLQKEISHDKPSVLLSEPLFTPNASLLDAERRKRGGSSYAYTGNGVFAGKFDPKQLPTEWQAFSGYDSVLMTDRDWTNAPAGARNALISWMTLGGQLVVYSTGGTSPPVLGIPADTGYGSLDIRSIESSLKLPPLETLKLVDTGNPVRARGAANRGDFSGTWPLQVRFGSLGFNYGIFIGVLIVFAILVGPVNLFVLAKSGQRHRLFITTPLISLGASLVLVGLIISKDGFGGRGMRLTLMEVRPDGGRNAAFVHQEQVSRTGILLGSRFTVDPLCYFSPVCISASPWARFTDSNSRGSFNLQPVDGRMNASGDWWQSRSEHGHAISAVLSTRGRIESTATPNTFVSTFDFPIESFYYLDEKQQWHRAESITTGKAFSLTPVDASMVEPVLAVESAKFTGRNRGMLDRAKTRSAHFVAITNQAPGVGTMPGIRWTESRTVITGPVVTP